MSSDNEFSPFLDRLADAASDAIMPHFRSLRSVDNKLTDGFDPVTDGDRDGERAMRALINEHYPDHGIIGEEFGSENVDAAHIWVLDPIDGTRAFVSGLPTWGTLIGLRNQDRALCGMMCQPFTGERYAGDGQKAWYTGPGGAKPLKVRACADISEATLFTTMPDLFSAAEQPCYDRVEARARLIRYGTDCYAYGIVAAGHGDLVVEAGMSTYDILALIPVIEGAGGVVTNWQGGPALDGGTVLACGDKNIHRQALEILNAG